MTSPVLIPAGHKLLAADFDAYENLTGSWVDYSGSLQWTASTNPAIGNGTITAAYIQVGKLVIYKGRISMGSTTTFGTGGWVVSLPVTAVAATVEVGAAFVYDSSTDSGRTPATIRLISTTTVSFYTSSGGGGTVTGTVPITWAQSDALRWVIIYEAA